MQAEAPFSSWAMSEFLHKGKKNEVGFWVSFGPWAKLEISKDTWVDFTATDRRKLQLLQSILLN